MQITPLGDSALILRVRENFEGAPEETLNAVLRTQRCLEATQLPGVIELAPAYTTVAVFYDPTSAVEAGAPHDDVFGWYERRIRDALKSVARVRDRGPAQPRRERPVEIPVCYDTEFAPDLNDVARHAGRSTQEVVDLHSGAQYRVHCVGFTPGFPFLGGLDPRVATPRRSTPRKEIAAGSVGIGGAQTGIYPVKSPGGWNIIGRTPLRLFDPQKDPPALLRAGNRVRFRAITREEFDRLK
ncbi:MAG TPA: 5-oxoprolinase subunit PxpB [Chthoniobacterales bacterium]|nr:5-oxoprolinase subunit PxpB [Chthoniobacterales bacterium]